MMKDICLYLGYSCNQDCIFCATDGQEGAKEHGDLSTEEVINRLNESEIVYGSNVTYNGGEPMIRKDILYLIRYASDKGAKVSIMSNGTRFHDFNFALQAVEAGLRRIAVPIHGHNAKLHDSLTQRKGSFDKTVRGIKNLFSIRDDYGYPLYIELKTCVCKPNMKHLPEIIELMSTEFNRPQEVGIHPLAITGSAIRNKEKVVVRLTDIMPYVKRAIDIGRSYGQQMMVKNIPACMFGDPTYFDVCFIPRNMVRLYNIEKTKTTNTEVMGREPKPPQCKSCIRSHICDGVWHSYGEEFGYDELKPITN